MQTKRSKPIHCIAATFCASNALCGRSALLSLPPQERSAFAPVDSAFRRRPGPGPDWSPLPAPPQERSHPAAEYLSRPTGWAGGEPVGPLGAHEGRPGLADAGGPAMVDRLSGRAVVPAQRQDSYSQWGEVSRCRRRARLDQSKS
jgi:hypothetical protein